MRINLLTRTSLTILLTALFLAVPFLVSLPTAKMQTGANKIAFSRYYEGDTYKIFTINADGTGETELALGLDPAWSPNGQEIAYVRAEAEHSEIYLMSADGSNQRQLTETFLAFGPAWSPDGSRIAFVSLHEGSDHIYTVNVDGTNLQRLPVPAEFIGEHAPVWTPDGSKIIFIGNRSTGNGSTDTDFYSIKTDGTELVRLTNIAGLFNFTTPALSPDGTKLVFEYQSDLYSVTTDGTTTLTNLTNSTSNTDRNPAFSPNGAKIVFERNKLLFVMDADGSNQTALEVVGSYPAWNPTAVFPTPTPTPTPSPSTADVSVQMSVSSQTVPVGSQAVYTITVKNNGAASASNATLTDVLPAEVNFLAASSSQGACFNVGNQVNCQIGTLAFNQEAIVQLTVSPKIAGTIANGASASAAEPDPDATNNQAAVSFTATGECARVVTSPYEITRTQWRYSTGNGLDELILTVKNRSTSTLHPRIIFVFDNLPQGVTIDSSVLAGVTQCNAPLGSPFVVGEAPNGREWKPGQQATVRVLFRNPQRRNIPVNLRLMNGQANP